MLSGHQKKSGKKRCILRCFALGFLFLAALFAAAFIFLPLPGAIPVLMYHFVGTQEDARIEKNYVSRESFEKQMVFLSRAGYRLLSLQEYEEIMSGKRKPRGREILITFDDGNPSFEKVAFPILERERIPSTLFLISESVKQDLPGSMSHEEVRKLLASGLVSIGSHTKTHPFLSQMTEEEMKEEISVSKKDLEALFGIPIDTIAYPMGNFDERVLKAVQEAGYRFGFTTSHKKLKGFEPGLYTLTREKITVTSDYPFVFWFKVSGLYQFFRQTLHRVRYGTAY